jgi:surface antigen
VTLGGDDYHQHALRQADGNDQWGYAWENCVSYLCEQSVFDLHIPPPLYGTAWRWPANARAQGKLVTSHPMLWSAACFGRNQNGAGPEGHVALVTAVPNSKPNMRSAGRAPTPDISRARQPAVRMPGNDDAPSGC